MRRLLSVVALLFASVCAFGQGATVLFPPLQGPNGTNIPFAKLTFCTTPATFDSLGNCTNTVTVYQDIGLTTPYSSAIETDGLGNFPPNALIATPVFFAAANNYCFTATGSFITQGANKCTPFSVPPGSSGAFAGNLTAQSINGMPQVGNGAGEYSSMAACNAACALTTGTKCQIAAGWSEGPWTSNLVLGANSCGFEFLGSASINMGGHEITCATGSLASLFITGPTVTGALNQTGSGNTGSFAFGSNSTVFKYTGSGAAISCGDSSGSKTSIKLENFGIDLTGAGSSAIGVDAINWQLGGWIRGLGILGTGSVGSQVGIQVDAAGGNNSFNWSIVDNQIVNPGTGIALNATAQEIAMRGNQIIGTVALGCNTGVATSGIGIWWTGGDIDGCTTTVAFGGSAAESDFSVVSNPSVFTFGASTQDNFVRYLGTATPTVTNSGAVSNLLTWRGLRFGGYDIAVSGTNFTCSATCTSLLPITGLQWVLPATQAAHTYHYSCDFSYQQATATGGVEFGFSSTATLTFFNVDGFAATSSTAVNTIGAPVSSTTGFVIVQATPANTTGQFGVHMGGAFLVPAAGTTINWEVLTQNSSDAVTVFQQSGCTLNP